MTNRGKALKRWIHKEVPYTDDGPRRDYIAGVISHYASPDDSIFEIGCNAGSNLLALKRRGFSRLAGVDVSTRALNVAKTRLDFEMYHGDITEIMDELIAAGPWDVVFSLAVLMHIHPDCDEQLRRIPEMVGKYLITCEWELTGNKYITPRDHKEFFGDALHEVHMEEGLHAELIHGYTLRIFEKVAT